MSDKELKHVGILGMKWGHRSGGNPVERHMAKAAKADKLFPKGGTLHRKAAERIKTVSNKKIKNLNITKKDKEGFKKIAKGVGIGLAIVGSAKISSMLMNRAINKYYAKKMADAIGDMLIKRGARGIINLP